MKASTKKLKAAHKVSKETTIRHGEMYEILLEKRQSAAAITKELNRRGFIISKRSVERDLDALKGFNGLLFRRDQSNLQRKIWSVDPIYFTSPSELDEAGALAIVTAQKQLELTAPPNVKRSLEDAFMRANEIISQSNSTPSRWHQRVRVVSSSYTLKQPDVEQKILDFLRDTVLDNDVIRISYETHSNDKRSEMIGTALGLYYRGPVAYLLLFHHEEEKVRHCPLSRIKSVKLEVTIRKQGLDTFDIEQYEKTGFLAFRYGESFRLKAMIFSSVRREIEEAHLGDNQVITHIFGNDDFKILEVDVPYTLNLIQWLLARAAYLKVLGPQEFKVKFEEEIRRALYNVSNKTPNVPKAKNFIPTEKT